VRLLRTLLFAKWTAAPSIAVRVAGEAKSGNAQSILKIAQLKKLCLATHQNSFGILDHELETAFLFARRRHGGVAGAHQITNDETERRLNCATG
jgi:hypothetical protein